MPTLRTTIRPVVRTTARLIPGSLGLAPAFSPSSLNPLQRFLDEDPTYYGSVAGYPVFTPEESYTSIAQPRSGRCWLFDGTNDFANRGARLTSGSISALTVAAWVKTSATTGIIAAENDDSINQRGWSMGLSAGGTFNAFVSADGSFAGSKSYSTTTLVNTNSWVHVAFTFAANSLVLYINGSVATVTVGNEFTVNSIFNSSAFFGIGARRLNTTPATFFGGSIKDVIVDQAAWSDAEVLSLATTHTVPTGKTPLAFFRCEEESGTTGYNSLANSNHLTLTNITQSTFHALDTGVRFSDANERGHTPCKVISNGSSAYTNINTWISSAAKTGDCRYDFIVPTINTNMLFGVQIESAAASLNNYEVLDVGLQLTSNTNVRVFVNSVTTDHVVPTMASNSTFAIVRTGTTASIFVNGSLVTTKSISSSPLFGVATFANTGVPVIVLNESENGNVGSQITVTNLVIPRSVATPSQDVAGNTLGVTGPVAKLATAEVRCVTGDGSAVYGSATLAVGTTLTICARVRFAATGTQAIIAVNGSAGNGVLLRYDGNTTIQWFSNTGNAVQNITVPSLVGSWHHVAITHTGSNYAFYLNGALISSGTLGPLWVAGNEVAVGRYNSSGGINYLNGSISDVRIYSDVKTLAEIQAINTGTDNRTNLVAHWTGQEGPGTANTNRTIYDTVGSNNLTLVNGTVSNIWANYCPFVRSHCVEYGGNVAANGSFIPGRIGSNLDAAGNVKLLLPGEPSQYDLIYPNRWNMPALVNVGITSSTAWGKTTTVQATSPADTKFRNTTKGTKNIVVREPLVDPAKTQLQDYVSA